MKHTIFRGGGRKWEMEGRRERSKGKGDIREKGEGLGEGGWKGERRGVR